MSSDKNEHLSLLSLLIFVPSKLPPQTAAATADTKFRSVLLLDNLSLLAGRAPLRLMTCVGSVRGEYAEMIKPQAEASGVSQVCFIPKCWPVNKESVYKSCIFQLIQVEG